MTTKIADRHLTALKVH